MKILQVKLESGDGKTYVMFNPTFKVLHPDSSEVCYNLTITGIEVGNKGRTIILKPTTVKKDLGKSND